LNWQRRQRQLIQRPRKIAILGGAAAVIQTSLRYNGDKTVADKEKAKGIRIFY
jgi:hypothetical protein